MGGSSSLPGSGGTTKAIWPVVFGLISGAGAASHCVNNHDPLVGTALWIGIPTVLSAINGLGARADNSQWKQGIRDRLLVHFIAASVGAGAIAYKHYSEHTETKPKTNHITLPKNDLTPSKEESTITFGF